MARLIRPGAAAERKGCSKKTIHRMCEQGKLNHKFDPTTGEYQVYDDKTFAQWQPGPSGDRPETT